MLTLAMLWAAGSHMLGTCTLHILNTGQRLVTLLALHQTPELLAAFLRRRYVGGVIHWIVYPSEFCTVDTSQSRTWPMKSTV